MEKIKCVCVFVFNSDLILNCELVRNIHKYMAQLEFPFYFKVASTFKISSSLEHSFSRYMLIHCESVHHAWMDPADKLLPGDLSKC